MKLFVFLRKRASLLIRAINAAFLTFCFHSVAFADSSDTTELQQLMEIGGKIIAGALLFGCVFSVLALVKAGYAYAVDDNPQQARDRLRRAIIGVILMLVSLPFVSFVWYNLLSDYGYTLPSTGS